MSSYRRRVKRAVKRFQRISTPFLPSTCQANHHFTTNRVVEPTHLPREKTGQWDGLLWTRRSTLATSLTGNRERVRYVQRTAFEDVADVTIIDYFPDLVRCLERVDGFPCMLIDMDRTRKPQGGLLQLKGRLWTWDKAWGIPWTRGNSHIQSQMVNFEVCKCIVNPRW